MKRIILTVFLFAAAALGQVGTPPGIIFGNPTPGGACSPGAGQIVTSTGTIYTCVSSVWTSAGTSSFPGVTSDGANGLTVVGAVTDAVTTTGPTSLKGTVTATTNNGNVMAAHQFQYNYTQRSTLTKVVNMKLSSPQQLWIAVSPGGDSTGLMGLEQDVCQWGLATADPGANSFAGVMGGASSSTLSQCANSLAMAETLTGDAVAIPSNGDFIHFYGSSGYTVGSTSSGCVQWSVGGGFFTSNLNAVLYDQSPGAGTLTISTNNGSGWNLQATINAAGTLAGKVWSQNVGAPVGTQIQACGTGGTIYLWNGLQVNTTINGTVTLWMAESGTSVPDWASSTNAVIQPWLNFLKPDKILFHAEQNGNTNAQCLVSGTIAPANFQTYTYWFNLLSAPWFTANPNVDVVIAGQWPASVGYDANQCIYFQADQLGKWAAANNQTYIDQYYNVLGSDALQQSLGWISNSEPHYDAPGQLSIGNLMWQREGVASWPSLNNTQNTNNLSVTTNTVYVGPNATITEHAGNLGVDFNIPTGVNNPYYFKNGGTVQGQIGAGSTPTFFPPIQTRDTSGNAGPYIARQNVNGAGVYANQNGSTPRRWVAGSFETPVFTANVSGTYQINLLNGQTQVLTLTGATTLSNPATVDGLGDNLSLMICQDGTGGRSLAMGGAYLSTPLATYMMPQAANACMSTSMVFNGTFYLLGAPVCTTTGLSYPCPTDGTPTYTAGTNVTSCAAAAGYTNTNNRGVVTIVGGTATTGTICTINFSTTLGTAPGVCRVTQNGGAVFLGIGENQPTTTGFAVTAGVSVTGATVTVDYSCLP